MSDDVLVPFSLTVWDEYTRDAADPYLDPLREMLAQGQVVAHHSDTRCSTTYEGEAPLSVLRRLGLG
jgi:hypothetical protein